MPVVDLLQHGSSSAIPVIQMRCRAQLNAQKLIRKVVATTITQNSAFPQQMRKQHLLPRIPRIFHCRALFLVVTNAKSFPERRVFLLASIRKTANLLLHQKFEMSSVVGIYTFPAQGIAATIRGIIPEFNAFSKSQTC
jgi:hypothetical protein